MPYALCQILKYSATDYYLLPTTYYFDFNRQILCIHQLKIKHSKLSISLSNIMENSLVDQSFQITYQKILSSV